MQPRKWTNSDFNSWIARCGLSATRAAEVLGVHEATVHRLKSGQTVMIKNSIADKAIEFEAKSKATVGEDAAVLDSSAMLDGWADVCEQAPLVFITGLSSAIARGWTSANSNGYLTVSQPIRIASPEVPDHDLKVWPTEDFWGIEVRADTNGRAYRVASIERTIVDMLVHESDLGEQAIEEAFLGAFALSEQRPDASLIYQRARQTGVEYMESRLSHYIQPYLQQAA